MRCEQCGSPLVVGAAFCTNCGRQSKMAAPVPGHAPQWQTEAIAAFRRLPRQIQTALVGLVVMLGAAFMVTAANAKPEPTPPPVASAPAPVETKPVAVETKPAVTPTRQAPQRPSVPVPVVAPRPPQVDLEVLEFKAIEENGVSYAAGKIRNNTYNNYSYVQVEINMYDEAGTQVGSTMANVNNLEPGGVWAFKAVDMVGATNYRVKKVTGF